MNKSGYEVKKWHARHPLFLAENSQEIQHDCIFRRDRGLEYDKSLVPAMPG
jgi:hypothetical protein